MCASDQNQSGRFAGHSYALLCMVSCSISFMIFDRLKDLETGVACAAG